MKKQALTLVSVLSLLLAAGSAFAQIIRADIPFNFIVDKATLPAGQYAIHSAGMSDKTFLIRDGDNKLKSMFIAHGAISPNGCKQTKLVFTRYADQFSLSQIWVEGNSLGHQLRKSPREREAEVAMENMAEQVVVLAKLH